MSAPITVRIVRHDLANAEILADLFLEGVRIFESVNLVGEGVAIFDPVTSGDDGDLRSRAVSLVRGTREWQSREARRVVEANPLRFGIEETLR